MKNKFITKNIFLNLSLLILSILLSVVIIEGICRLILNPVDYLTPVVVNDKILVYKVNPSSGGYDNWGYRNNFVPKTADIVAIGDSMTYGYNATKNNSWPAILEHETGKSVYNVSMGGFGPVQYYYLLKNKALTLDPTFIIIGFYYGNDLANAYSLVYETEYWSFLKAPGLSFAKGSYATRIDIPEDNPETLFIGARRWLSKNSMFYGLVIRSVFGNIVRLLEMKACSYTKEKYTYYNNNENGINTMFTPSLRKKNLADPKIQEGLRISLEMFNKMNEICKEKDVKLLVLLLPTKISVFHEYIENNPEINNAKVVDAVIANERQINKTVKAYFEKHDIAYIDMLTPMKSVIGKKQIYSSNKDNHPNKNGYKTIVDSIFNYMEKH